ncbi:putative dithiol-disulfide isomerase, DsbA family [Fodinibius salinus]|uniref:Putative dithiol-disulfide isomerase, DsbA family n=1 Tax=Fodinibius salinus TaxID=860790 RepID=A0A5D3YQP6_9BACT|nr:DsbA family oxidoreductase [Fodinibius salinus]TYP95399.1 putative dithiol-disulfide isomerase, DsbA family [Fodinibius salinus]
MKVEIWSDVVCPFCYIGKRRFEEALAEFEYTDELEIQWRSFQLNPDLKTNPEANINEHLADAKGWSPEQTKQMMRHVTDMASEVGLEYEMDRTIVANSFDAQRLIQFAKSHNKGQQAEEVLFEAYFTNGQNIDNIDTLVNLATQLDLDAQDTKSVLQSDQFTNTVKHDIQTANGMGISGVPFFLFNRKYAVSGARGSEIFLKALKQSWNEWMENQPMEIEEPSNNSTTCTSDDNC